MSIDIFRAEARDWVETHCPASMRVGAVHFEDAYEIYQTDDANQWRDQAAARGWTAPTWPASYGGGGLNKAEAQVLSQELARIKALPPATGMGLAMIGPTLLEFGTEDQKLRHLPKIVTGEAQWCQGYSEPGAGSDLAGLQTKAVLEGDQFVINGQKIWTSGAQHANWMFALVRTDPSAPKHDGISFILLPMQQAGVTVKPIKLISGSSPFCETFLDNARADRNDLIGSLNKGWTVGKRLLQYERNGASARTSLATANARAPAPAPAQLSARAPRRSPHAEGATAHSRFDEWLKGSTNGPGDAAASAGPARSAANSREPRSPATSAATTRARIRRFERCGQLESNSSNTELE